MPIPSPFITGETLFVDGGASIGRASHDLTRCPIDALHC